MSFCCRKGLDGERVGSVRRKKGLDKIAGVNDDGNVDDVGGAGLVPLSRLPEPKR